MQRTSAPFYYHIAEDNLKNAYALPFDWNGGDYAPVVRLSLDRDALAFIEDCVRRYAGTDGLVGEIQAVRERVDRIIAGELEAARAEEYRAKNTVSDIQERYGVRA